MAAICPNAYSHTHDPFVALSLPPPQPEKSCWALAFAWFRSAIPIVTAKCVASLDQLSSGRFLFGIGGGWNVDEMENHGARYETRFKLMRERILAMKALWTQEEASFHGEMVNFDPVWLYPKPAQRPHPPILLGGSSDHTLKRVVEFCDGWLPIAGMASTPSTKSRACVKRHRRRGGTSPHFRSTRSRPRPKKRLSPNIGKRDSTLLSCDPRSHSRRNPGSPRPVRRD